MLTVHYLTLRNGRLITEEGNDANPRLPDFTAAEAAYIWCSENGQVLRTVESTAPSTPEQAASTLQAVGAPVIMVDETTDFNAPPFTEESEEEVPTRYCAGCDERQPLAGFVGEYCEGCTMIRAYDERMREQGQREYADTQAALIQDAITAGAKYFNASARASALYRKDEPSTEAQQAQDESNDTFAGFIAATNRAGMETAEFAKKYAAEIRAEQAKQTARPASEPEDPAGEVLEDFAATYRALYERAMQGTFLDEHEKAQPYVIAKCALMIAAETYAPTAKLDYGYKTLQKMKLYL